jgi:type I restriction-modification system DNA methylase subunit
VTSADASRDRGVLFAKAYLDSKLAELKEEQHTYLVETLKEWLDKTDSGSLKALVASFVGPVLDVLGHIRSELEENSLTLYGDRSRQKAVSLCYVVSPHESLDQTSKGRNYAVSLIIALRKIGLKWGILTNGLLWRLYCVKEKAPFETYFQVDLGEALRTRDSKETFLLAEFFGATAFLPKETSRCSLDVNRHESDEETREIEKHLESKIESILGKICMGFIESEGKKSYTEDEKRVVFSNSIYLLYRILFVLYAEARGLLPLQNIEYYEKSMEKLMSIAKDNHSSGITDPHSREMWNSLCELFDWINRGNHALLIPPYNGGLFDDGEKPYLANHVINDGYLSEALFDLGFRDERGEIAGIDYNDLSVRPLGSLYEGILEYQLFIAPERMVRRKEEKVYRFIPETLAGKITKSDVVIEKGDIYFSQSSEERKLTGSYYTPEDVVQYIVENSLGQYLVDVGKELRALVDIHAEAHVIAVDDKERRRVEKYTDAELVSFIENRVLSIKVLDPAMGSGHFLVNATHFLSNFIVESLYSTEWENDSVDTSLLSWRRRVVEKCIFGVDLNDLATELAKLSLWLITADENKPLTFLDHHLRTGNSLFGTDFSDLGTLPGSGKTYRSRNVQATLNYPIFEKEFIPKVLQVFGEMEVSSEKIEDVEKKKGKFREWEELKKGLQAVADVWLATLLGYKIGEKDYQSLLANAMSGKETVIADVKKIAMSPRNRFFHWWLEFPEVFFPNEKKMNEKGFDIVIGNPPYGDILNRLEKNAIFRFVTKNANEVAANFIELSLNVAKKTGYAGFIVANSLAINRSTSTVRDYIRQCMSVSKMALFGTRPAKIFPDADIRVLIFVGQKDEPENSGVIFTTEAIKFTAEQRDSLFANLSFESTEGLVLGTKKIGDGTADFSLPKVGRPIIRNILLKLKKKSTIVVRDRINKPGFNEKMEFRKTGRYWLNALEEMPYRSTKIEEVRLQNAVERDFCILMINSSLFYLFWSTYGNSRDFPLSLLERFPLPSLEELNRDPVKIKELKEEISTCLLKSFQSDRGSFGEFRTNLCKGTIDSIDDFLGSFYELDGDETEFIKKYDCNIRKTETSDCVSSNEKEV